MAFTQADLDNINAAILALATGSRVVRVQIGDKLIEKAEITMERLFDLRALIDDELGSTVSRILAGNAGRASE